MHSAPHATMPAAPRRSRWAAAVGIAALLVTSMAAPSAAEPGAGFQANDLPLGDHRSDLEAGDFTVRANDSSHVTVSEHSRSSAGGDEFTQRLQLNGAGTAEARSVQFEAEAGASVTVHAQSGSGSDDRALGLYDSSWNQLATVPALRGDSGNVLSPQTFRIEEDGTYWVASPSSGVNIYSISLGEYAEDPDQVEWDDVENPAVTNAFISEEAPGQIQVEYTGLIDAQRGGDLLRAQLHDAAGELVDEQLNVVPSESGTVALTPPATGDYSIQLQLERHAEESARSAESYDYSEFILPLAAPEITSTLTSEVSGSDASVTVQWTAPAEAEHYTVEVREDTDGSDWTTVEEEIADTQQVISGLSVGQSYLVHVTAHRTGEGALEAATTSEPASFEVSGEVQRWNVAHAGVGSRGEVTEHEDGAIEFDLRGNNSKIADSEDGFWYYYTEIDPDQENFSLTATFRVDHSDGKDNQSGFGIIAIDDFIPDDVASRYFNSAGTMAAKYEFGAGGEEGVRYGTPGGKYVHGYTGSPRQASAERDLSDSRAFDWEYKPDYTFGSNTNPPRFEAGESYTFTLRRSNTGFHSIWHREGGDEEVIYYDPDFLLTQSEDSFYLGMFAARDIGVTVTDWSLSTVHPEDDDAAEEAPTQYIRPRLSSDVTSTTAQRELDVPLLSTVHGEAVIRDADGEEVTEAATLEPDAPEHFTVSDLQPGLNEFTAEFTPAEEQPQFAENQELESLDPVVIPLEITVNSYGEPGEAIWVAPEGDAEATGTRADPLDLHTAVAFAQPGQQIVLSEGTYALENALRIERGNSGTEEDPITLMSEPGARATLDLENSEGGGIILRGDWWHIYNLEITGGGGYQKPMHVQGHHNVIERVESHHNQDTGIQISGHDTEPPSMWPSYNTVVSSVAHNNADPQSNDADGFAAKLTAGEGNVFRWTISYHNVDDGYDLYAKSTEGPIGTVLIEDSVAFNNGRLEADTEAERTSDGQGFKMGGESMPGDHLVRNSVAYGNLGNGVASNSGPDMRMQNITSVFNHTVLPGRTGGNISLRTNADWTNYEATGVISWGATGTDTLDLKDQDDELLRDPSNYFNGRQGTGTGVAPAASSITPAATEGQPDQVTEDWFVSTDYESIRPEIAEDGSIAMNGLFELTDVAPENTGARLTGNPNPTQIDLLPEVTPGIDDDDDEGEDGSDDGADGSDAADGTGTADGEDDADGAEADGSAGAGDDAEGAAEGAGTGPEGDSTPDADGSAGAGGSADGAETDAEAAEAAGEESSDSSSALARTGSMMTWTAVVSVLLLMMVGTAMVTRARKRVS